MGLRVHGQLTIKAKAPSKWFNCWKNSVTMSFNAKIRTASWLSIKNLARKSSKDTTGSKGMKSSMILQAFRRPLRFFTLFTSVLRTPLKTSRKFTSKMYHQASWRPVNTKLRFQECINQVILTSRLTVLEINCQCFSQNSGQESWQFTATTERSTTSYWKAEKTWDWTSEWCSSWI